MPGIIEALSNSGTPFSILTKGSLLRRDLPLLAAANEKVPVDLAMSIAVYDDELQQSVEPGTPSTAARLATVTAAREAGLPVTVFLMPILPYLTDTRAHLDAALERVAASGASAVMHTALHLRPGTKEWFMQWLGAEHPELVATVRGDVQIQRVCAQGVSKVAGRQVPAAGSQARVVARPGRPGDGHRALARAAAGGAIRR